MPPANSTSGGAHGVLSHAMHPVCESQFDSYTSTRKLAPTFPLPHAVVTACGLVEEVLEEGTEGDDGEEA